jgi:hypothetical protein
MCGERIVCYAHRVQHVLHFIGHRSILVPDRQVEI